MAVDSTTEWCAHFGNDVSAAELYLIDLVASVSAIYDSEMLLLVQLSFLRTHCGAGGAVGSGSLLLSWGDPCNAATTPGQDFAVYRGNIGAFTGYDSLTCSTNGEQSYLAQVPPDGSFFLVVTHTSASEGSYGKTGAGQERPAAALCGKPQEFEECP